MHSFIHAHITISKRIKPNVIDLILVVGHFVLNQFHYTTPFEYAGLSKGNRDSYCYCLKL